MLVVAWGEFGRTLKMNSNCGRDYWPRVSPAIMFGCGIRTGQVISATDKIAGECTECPIHFQDITATMFQHLGLNPNEVTIIDTTGRSQFLCDTGRPVRELLS